MGILSKIFAWLRKSKQPPQFNEQAASDLRDVFSSHKQASQENNAAITYDRAADLPSYSTIGINYRAADGESTSRVITVRQLDALDGEPMMITAFCHLRGSQRVFRADRIESLFDPETGEVFRAVNLRVEDKPSALRKRRKTSA